MQVEAISLIEILNEITDNRRAEGKRFPLSMLLIISIMATMSGYLGYRAIADFIKANRDELLEVFKPKKDRLPSFQTVRRALIAIDFEEFANKFYKWASVAVDIDENEWFSMDGKAIRGTIEGNNYNSFTNLVSLFSSQSKEILYAGKVDNKSNEIPLIQTMLKKLGLKGKNITIDALHCQKKTTEVIIDSGNDYTIGVKENQPILLEKVKKISLYPNQKSFSRTIELNRGRIELREAFVYDAPEELKEDWKNISKIIRIERTTKDGNETTRKGGEISEETAYFISSKDEDSEYFNKGIRLHWSIENSLHYVKDVTFKEDASRIKKGNSAENNSMIKNIVINIFRGENCYESMAQAVRLNCNKIKKMYDKLKGEYY